MVYAIVLLSPYDGFCILFCFILFFYLIFISYYLISIFWHFICADSLIYALCFLCSNAYHLSFRYAQEGEASCERHSIKIPERSEPYSHLTQHNSCMVMQHFCMVMQAINNRVTRATFTKKAIYNKHNKYKCFIITILAGKYLMEIYPFSWWKMNFEDGNSPSMKSSQHLMLFGIFCKILPIFLNLYLFIFL